MICFWPVASHRCFTTLDVIQVSQPHEASGVHSDPDIVQGFLSAAKSSQELMHLIKGEGDQTPVAVEERQGETDVPVLVSGAGHDALAMADITKVPPAIPRPNINQ